MKTSENRPRLHPGCVWVILKKDAKQFVRNPLGLTVMLAGIIGYVAIYWMLPGERKEQPFYIGISHQGMNQVVEEARERNQERNVVWVEFDSVEALRDAVADPKDDAPRLVAGVHFPADFLNSVTAKRDTTVSVYTDGAGSPALVNFLRAEFRELAFRAAGEPIPVSMPELSDLMVGTEQARSLAPVGHLVRPSLATLLLLFEILLIALLTSAEARSGVASAILATPVRLGHLVLAKASFGIALAFAQVVLLFLLIGALGENTLLILGTLFLGATLAGGCGFFAGSRGRDLLGAVGWSLVFLLPMAVPAIASLLPGSSTLWIRAIPTWPLVEILTRVTLEAASPGDVAFLLVLLAAWAVLFFAVGFGAFRRMVTAL